MNLQVIFYYQYGIVKQGSIRDLIKLVFIEAMSAKNFTTVGKLGQGAFGTVDKVVRHEDGQYYAMKRVKIMDMKEKDKRNALNEVRLLASINHPNIVNYCEAFYDEKDLSLCTVMELAENGDLSSRIKAKVAAREQFYQYEIWRIGNDILSGLEALHQKKIIHRDIKPANIFFGKEDTAKIGDMNVSLVLKSNLAYTQIGTPFYASPEIWNDEPYSYQCDIWSLGCVMYEMCCLKRPFEAQGMDRLYAKIRSCRYEQIPLRFSEELSNVIMKCLSLRRSRIKTHELRQIFNEKIAPKQEQSPKFREETNDSENPELMDTIKFPVFSRQLSKCLPKSNYESQKRKNMPKTDSSLGDEEEQYRVLDQFLKPKGRIRPNLSKRQSQNTTVKSYKVLPVCKNFSSIEAEPPQERKSYLSKVPSFQRALNLFSPRKALHIDEISLDPVQLKRRRMRKAMYGS